MFGWANNGIKWSSGMTQDKTLFEIGLIANSLLKDEKKVEQIQSLLNMGQGVCVEEINNNKGE